jgi:hypothetical protein
MRYRRPNRRVHKPYSASTQLWAILLSCGLITAIPTYGWGIPFFVILAIICTWGQ